MHVCVHFILGPIFSAAQTPRVSTRRGARHFERGRGGNRCARVYGGRSGLLRFSAFQVAGRRPVSLAFAAGRRVVAVRELLLVVQENAAQRPPEVVGAGFVDVVSDHWSPRRPTLAGRPLDDDLRSVAGHVPPDGRAACAQGLSVRALGTRRYTGCLRERARSYAKPMPGRRRGPSTPVQEPRTCSRNLGLVKPARP